METIKRTKLNQAILSVLMLSVAPALFAAEADSNQTNKTIKAEEVSKDSKASGTKNQKNKDVVADNKSDSKENFSKDTQDKASEYMPEMVVTGEVVKDTHYTSPSSRVKRSDIERQNAQTVEEAIKYQPSLQIRQRFIGDPNGILSIRGADMMSTARNMVYADGLPLHNQLQASYNGAPRWSMVGPNEIDAVDVVYGPYSAEYSGNSIGGVVNMKTRMPKKEEFYTEASYFAQPYSFTGKDAGTYDGNREFFSYGNRLKDTSVYLSYNRLDATSQPMSYFIDNTGLRTPSGATGATTVYGAIPVSDTRGKSSYIYGDTGPELVHSDLVKAKLGYDITPDLQAIFTGAFEERTRKADSRRTYLTTADGTPYYGDALTTSNSTREVKLANGMAFNPINNNFAPQDELRQTMQVGLQLKGAISDYWNIDTTASYMDVFTGDEKYTAYFSPLDPLNTQVGNTRAGAGYLQVFDNFNWKNYDLKLSTPQLFGLKKLEFFGGYHFDNYSYGFRQFDIANIASRQIGPEQLSKRNTGDTTTNAIFAQTAYHFLPDWDLTLGGRYEWWNTDNGMVGSTVVPTRNDEAVSPKASLGYEPGPWKLRYSMGRAYRFPVIAEMYQSLGTPSQTLTANSNLKAEDGWSHNFMIEYGLDRGYIRANVFQDNIRNAIQNVALAAGQITSSAFQNIPEVSTTGVELVLDKQRVFDSKFDFNFNSTWMDSIIEKGGPNVVFTQADGTALTYNLTGKRRPLLPEWRFNALTTYHITEAWDFSMAGRYTSKPFNDPDNKDYVRNVFGAADGFFFMDLKTSYRVQSVVFGKKTNTRFSAGINNVNDQTAFIYHPYPQRTYFMEAALSF